jgi:hypothetical protein
MRGGVPINVFDTLPFFIDQIVSRSGLASLLSHECAFLGQVALASGM